MSKLQLPILLLFTVLSFSVQAGKPSWVKQRPSEKDYFIGIGVASKTSGATDYMTQARNKALNEMASEIKVTISGNSILNQFENNSAIRQDYESKVQSTVMQTLEGYEVETWNGKTDYWVMVRMSKAKYEMRRRLAIDKALKTAQLHYEFAQRAIAQNEPETAIANLVKAVEAIAPYPNEDLMVKEFEGDINMGITLQSVIQKTLGNITIHSASKSIQISPNSKVQPVISVMAQSVTTEGMALPLSNMPVLFSFSKGNGVLTPSSVTNEEGVATSNILQPDWNVRMQEVMATLDISGYFADKTGSNPVVKAFFPDVLLPRCTITIELAKPKAWIDAEETVFDESSDSQTFVNQIKTMLSDQFYLFTPNRNEAEIVIKISTEFVEGEQNEGQGYTAYTVYGNYDLTVINAAENTTVFSDSASGIKGMASGNIDKALKVCRSNTLKYFQKYTMPRMEHVN